MPLTCLKVLKLVLSLNTRLSFTFTRMPLTCLKVLKLFNHRLIQRVLLTRMPLTCLKVLKHTLLPTQIGRLPYPNAFNLFKGFETTVLRKVGVRSCIVQGWCLFISLLTKKRTINPQDSGFRRTLVRGLPWEAWMPRIKEITFEKWGQVLHREVKA